MHAAASVLDRMQQNEAVKNMLTNVLHSIQEWSLKRWQQGTVQQAMTASLCYGMSVSLVAA